jgi:hypothetical protein
MIEKRDKDGRRSRGSKSRPKCEMCIERNRFCSVELTLFSLFVASLDKPPLPPTLVAPSNNNNNNNNNNNSPPHHEYSCIVQLATAIGARVCRQQIEHAWQAIVQHQRRH